MSGVRSDFPGKGAGFNNPVQCAAVQDDKKVIFGGHFWEYDKKSHGNMIRLMQDGSVDSSFNTGTGVFEGVVAGSFIDKVLIQKDRKILVAGKFWNFNGVPAGHLVRLMPDGSIDSAFKARVENKRSDRFPAYITDMALQDDGKIIIGGCFNLCNDSPVNCLARLNPDGSLDSDFTAGFNPDDCIGVSEIVTLNDGKVLVRGNFKEKIIRLESNGKQDKKFRLDKSLEYASRMALVPDGKILVNSSRGVVRLNSDGSIDGSFTQGETDNNVWGIYVINERQALVYGQFTKYNGVRAGSIARIWL